MKYKIHKCCNICKSSHSLLLYSIGDQNLLKCLKCGLVYFDKIRCDLGNLYNTDYYIKSESNNAIYFNYYSFDVIEHQVDLKKFYQKAASLLKPKGVLIFTVPNIGSVFNKILGKKAPAVQPLYHNYYFDLDWFKKNLPDLGWEIISLKRIFVAKITIDHLMLMSGIAFPQIANNKIFKTLRKYKLGAKIIPFVRMGGIEGIIQKK